MQDAMDVTTYEFSTLYSFYAYPNVVLPVIGGYLMDKVFGIRLGTIIYAIIIVVGQGNTFNSRHFLAWTLAF